MPALNHNKRMNAGLMREILIMELSRAIVSGNRSKAADVLTLVNRGFAKGPLADEAAIHKTALETHGVSLSIAQRIMDEIKVAGIRLDKTGAGRMKRSLAREMVRVLGEDVFDRNKVRDYKALASVDLLIQKVAGRRIDEAADLAKIEEYLVRHMTSAEPTPLMVDSGASRLAYQIAIDSYEREYGKSLDENQRELLAEHVKVSLGASPVGATKKLERHRRKILESIKGAHAVDGVGTDSTMVKRLTEAREELEKMDLTKVSTLVMERLMLFHDLRRTIEEKA